ncbi:MAG TPA: hypothetical protein VJQ25_00880 [Nitrospira sp.]|nr:hypothetical protein [Nitrospira sp.]
MTAFHLIFLDWFSDIEHAEDFVTRLWILLVTLIVISIFFLMAIHVPKNFSEWAMICLFTSFVIVVVRSVFLLISPYNTIPQPWALMLWTAALALLLPYCEYFRRRYLVPTIGWGWAFVAFIASISFLAFLAFLGANT